MHSLSILDRVIKLGDRSIGRLPTVSDFTGWLGETPEAYALAPFETPGFDGRCLLHYVWKKNGVTAWPFRDSVKDSPEVLNGFYISLVPDKLDSNGGDNLIFVSVDSIPPSWIGARRTCLNPSDDSSVIPLNLRYSADIKPYQGQVDFGHTVVNSATELAVLLAQLKADGWNSDVTSYSSQAPSHTYGKQFQGLPQHIFGVCASNEAFSCEFMCEKPSAAQLNKVTGIRVVVDSKAFTQGPANLKVASENDKTRSGNSILSSLLSGLASQGGSDTKDNQGREANGPSSHRTKCRDCNRCTETLLAGCFLLPFRALAKLFTFWNIDLFRRRCPRCGHRICDHTNLRDMY